MFNNFNSFDITRNEIISFYHLLGYENIWLWKNYMKFWNLIIISSKIYTFPNCYLYEYQ